MNDVYFTCFNISYFRFQNDSDVIVTQRRMATACVLNESYNVQQENVTSNSPGSNSNQEQIYSTTVEIEQYALPVICIFGLIGNSLSSITFFKRPLRRAPCSLYLAIRGLSDNGFLLSLLLTWVSSTFDLRLSQVRGVCQTIILMTFVCGCVSVWLCVLITFENFMLIQNPFIARRFCSSFVSKLCSIALVLFTVVIYSMSLWIMNGDCSPNREYTGYTQILVYTDTLLTLVIPIGIIFVLMTVIAYKVIKIFHIRRLNSVYTKQVGNGLSVKRRVIPIAKVTKMLFVVSLVFVSLNVPSHVIRLLILVGNFTQGHSTTTVTLATIQHAFQILYYLSFSINIIVYAVFGSNFRNVFRKSFCKYVAPTVSTQVQTEAVNTVRPTLRSITEQPYYTGIEMTLLVPRIDADK